MNTRSPRSALWPKHVGMNQAHGPHVTQTRTRILTPTLCRLQVLARAWQEGVGEPFDDLDDDPASESVDDSGHTAATPARGSNFTEPLGGRSRTRGLLHDDEQVQACAESRGKAQISTPTPATPSSETRKPEPSPSAAALLRSLLVGDLSPSMAPSAAATPTPSARAQADESG